MSNDGHAYVYQNVGFDQSASNDGHAYIYQNVGSFGVPSVVQRVKGFACRTLIGHAYIYQNVEET